MNPQDPLANLHPLREPAAIGWWPPAPGWWFLAAIALACLLVLVYLLIRRYRANAYRRRALAQLQILQQQYLENRDSRHYLAQINALLKSVALLAYPRREVAASNGQQWLEFLNQGCRAGEQFPADFATAAYRKVCPELDPEQTHRTAASWIKRHEVAR